MSSTTTFKQLGVIDSILQVCTEEEFEKPTEIQEKSIPYVIAGKDVIGEAATGSGKTLAFASGIIHRTNSGQGVQALIISPTRELAQQTTVMIRGLSKYKPLRIIPIYGGVSINPQITNLRRADVVIGTPGRLIDHIIRGTINLKRVKILVLDECDRLLDMGFLPDIEKIIDVLPENRQTLLFSATIPFEVNRLAQKYMHNPIDVDAESYVDPNKLTQYYFGPLEDSLKFSLLVHLLKQDKNEGLSMIFCNTRRYADILAKNLEYVGIKATVLHGGFSQHERTKRLNSFQSKQRKILVATDVAARGLDIEGVTYVYNYDLPDNRKQYIHRIGRTARAGNAGKAITLVSQRDSEKFFQLFRDNRNTIRKGQIPFIKKIHTPNITSSIRPRRRQNRQMKPRYPKAQFSRYSV
ncbi:MAG: DEAD/DEAH box helicase [Candidatus Hermodarchaeota archaeon]